MASAPGISIDTGASFFGKGPMKPYFAQVRRTIARTFDFGGRASRAEFLAYLVLSQLPVLVLGVATMWLADRALAEAIALGAVVLTSVPLFALCVRRCHDVAHSGWWSAPFLALVGRTLALDLIGLATGWPVRAAIEMVLSYVDWLLIVPAVASFVAMAAWPGRREGVVAASAPVAGGEPEV
jgi:uncharacterized membrane protein YhaH (DUF805 family)